MKYYGMAIQMNPFGNTFIWYYLPVSILENDFS